MTLFGDIPVLYINMDKHINRKDHILNILESGARIYHRIPGVNGSDLANKVQNNNIQIEMECIQYDITHEATKKAHVIGCLMSHLNGFKFAMDNEYDIFVVIEDDLNMKYKAKWDMSILEIIKSCSR
jgi:GR25 family glycosyltransferase involved in LPS biosynthesis